MRNSITSLLAGLSPCGNLLSHEMIAAVELSLPLKEHEAKLKNLTAWGRIQCANGKDYLIAQSLEESSILEGNIIQTRKSFFSQDGITWGDLETVNDDIAELCEKVSSQQFQGDPGYVYKIPNKTDDENEGIGASLI